MYSLQRKHRSVFELLTWCSSLWCAKNVVFKRLIQCLIWESMIRIISSTQWKFVYVSLYRFDKHLISVVKAAKAVEVSYVSIAVEKPGWKTFLVHAIKRFQRPSITINPYSAIAMDKILTKYIWQSWDAFVARKLHVIHLFVHVIVFEWLVKHII